MKSRSIAVNIGNRTIGGGNPILVQSMAKTDTRDVVSTVNQILRLEEAGCDLVRVAVPDIESAEALSKIKSKIHIPLIADVHFDPLIAMESISQGVDKLRLNPSNIQDEEWIKKIALAAKNRSIPIRVGTNLGSFKKKPDNPVEALVKNALDEIKILESVDFNNIIVSIKTSDAILTVRANEKIAELVRYPLHIGITEAGPKEESLVKSSVGIGCLLMEGIGDTIRYSITADPIEEIKAGITLLRSLRLRKGGLEIVSCPTCGRCEINLFEIVKQVKEEFEEVDIPVRVAIMGCVVNGPGEAADADIGLAGGKKSGVIFRKGKAVRIVKEEHLYSAFRDELKKLIESKK